MRALDDRDVHASVMRLLTPQGRGLDVKWLYQWKHNRMLRPFPTHSGTGALAIGRTGLLGL